MPSPTPDEWRIRLTELLAERLTRIAPLRARLASRGPLPEGAEGLRDAYRAFQRKSRTNFAELVVNATADRMHPSSLLVAGGGTSDDDTARSVWDTNRMDLVAPDTYRDMLGVGCGYQMVTRSSRSGRAVITQERPEVCITWPDPAQPTVAMAGLTIRYDPLSGTDRTILFLPEAEPGDGGDLYSWTRPHAKGNETLPLAGAGGTGTWIPERTGESYPWVPIVPFENADGVGEFERHTDVLDRINYVVLQRLVIIAMQAYRQRATKGDLPETDEAGNVIDYGELFRPGAGALWHLPPGVELWESQTTDISGILAAAKDDIRDLSAVTRTPLASLLPDGGNQSAEGAVFAREGLIFKVGDRIARAQSAQQQIMAFALAVEADALDADLPRIVVDFAPPERVSLAEKADASSKATDIPWRTRMSSIWGFDGDTIDRMEAERAQDALLASFTLPAAAPAGQSAEAEPAGAVA